MGKSKFGMYIFLGAVVGGAASLLDKDTREHVIGKSKKALHVVQYYSKNKDQLTMKIEEQKEKYETIFEELSKNATYIKETVEDVKQLTPQIKELVNDTKEALVESKDEYNKMTAEATGNDSPGK